MSDEALKAAYVRLLQASTWGAREAAEVFCKLLMEELAAQSARIAKLEGRG